MKFRLTLAATLLFGVPPLTAHAQQQPWLADRRYGEGIGVRVGNLELHPGISGEFGYDSNYFLRGKGDVQPILAAYRLRVTPSISVSTLGAQRREGTAPGPPTVLQFRGGAYVSYNELIAADSAHSSEMSDQRHLDLGANLGLNAFPSGRVGVDGNLNYLRAVQPSNDSSPDNAFDRDTVSAGAGATWRPGGGLFSWRLGYEFTYNYFEDRPFRNLDNYQNQINMRGQWRFLPRTGLVYDGSYTLISYGTNAVQSDGGILTSRVGLNGLITSHLALLGMVGWAGTFYDARTGQPPQQFDSVVAQAEVKWFMTGQHSLDATSAPVGLSWVALGYTRDVQNSYLGNFYQRDRGYAQLSYLLGGVFVASVNAGLANIAFPASAATGAFSEQRVDASVFGEYRLSNTVGVNATVNYLQNITNHPPIPLDKNDPGGPADDLEFQEWQAFLGVRWFL